MEKNWQSIKTAPKDGTAILGHCKDYDEEDTITTVKWSLKGEYWTLCVCGSHAEDGEWWPTHWMSLPKHLLSGKFFVNDDGTLKTPRLL